MIRNSVLIDENSSVATLTPDTLAGMQKAAMKQAILERYSYRAKPAAQPQTAPAKVRSPYWQPVDEECSPGPRKELRLKCGVKHCDNVGSLQCPARLPHVPR